MVRRSNHYLFKALEDELGWPPLTKKDHLNADDRDIALEWLAEMMEIFRPQADKIIEAYERWMVDNNGR